MSNNQNAWGAVTNKMLNSKNFSLKAKALLTYINSKPPKWKFAVWRMEKEMLEGEKGIRTGLKELRDAGILSYKTRYNELGQPSGMDYIVKKSKTTKGWTAVPKLVLEDPNISLKAKGLWAYIKSKPQGWHFAVWRMQSQTKERTASIKSGLRELRKFGYLRHEIKRGEDGRANGVHYILNDLSEVKRIYEKRETFKTATPIQKGNIPGKDPHDLITFKSGIQNKPIESKNLISNTSLSLKKNIKKNENGLGCQKVGSLDTSESKQEIQGSLEARIEMLINRSLFIQAREQFFKELSEKSLKLHIEIFFDSYPHAKITSLVEYLIKMNKVHLKGNKATNRKQKTESTSDSSNQYSEKSYKKFYSNNNLKPYIWHCSHDNKPKNTEEEEEQYQKFVLERFEEQMKLANANKGVKKDFRPFTRKHLNKCTVSSKNSLKSNSTTKLGSYIRNNSNLSKYLKN